MELASIAQLLLLRSIAATSASASAAFHTHVGRSAPATRFDGIGGLSGGGATSTFLEAYEPGARGAILDWMFKPGFGAALSILKVEIGADDQTTDGCEACHMRSPTEVNCSRGFEWALMKAAAERNPNITLYGLPWGFAGWLGFGTTNPYHNVTATADYVARWVECGRDAHGLNISVLGLWNEAWQAAGRPSTDPWDYALALRRRLDGAGLGHVRIVAPDGDIGGIVPALAANASLVAALNGGALGAHYPGQRGSKPAWRALGLPLWSSEDYSTYSDATGAGCWARLLVQNAGWGYGATISWYLLGAFARGMDYDSDGVIRAEWPTSGHWEVTPMLWATMHWTLFTQPGWSILACATPQCALAGGGNFASLASPAGHDATIIVETFTHAASQCIRNDPPDWTVAPTQSATFVLPAAAAAAADHLEVWRSCSSWRYPADDDAYMQRLADLPVANGSVTLVADRNCCYTLTTLCGRTKPKLPPPAAGGGGGNSPAAAFPLPYREDFEGRTVGSEAPFFGDQQGKWQTVPAGGGRPGMASAQQLPLGAPWPILEPQCNDHGAPLSIIGDMFFESTRVAADVLLEEGGVGAGLALRVRNDEVAGSHGFFRGEVLGLFLYLGALPARDDAAMHTRENPGGLAPKPNTPLAGWALCADNFCAQPLAQGALPPSSPDLVARWHAVALEVTDNAARGFIDNASIFEGVALAAPPGAPSAAVVARCVANTTVWTDRVLAGGDYRQLPANATAADPVGAAQCARACCAERRCTGWAVAVSKCWLKDGGTVEMRTGEDACGVKPPAPAVPNVPPSGWAALIATLGRSQVDNFELIGTADSGAAAAPCAGTGKFEGATLVSTPCDYPGTRAAWRASLSSGDAVLQLASSPAVGKLELCIGAGADTGSIVLVPCTAATALVFNAPTGRVTPKGGGANATAVPQCLTAKQRERSDPTHPPLALAACGAIPNAAQQFQFNPATGALRQKGSQCIAAFPSGVASYRDCCVALCPSAPTKTQKALIE